VVLWLMFHYMAYLVVGELICRGRRGIFNLSADINGIRARNVRRRCRILVVLNFMASV
jgi:hypothetical protein